MAKAILRYEQDSLDCPTYSKLLTEALIEYGSEIGHLSYEDSLKIVELNKGGQKIPKDFSVYTLPEEVAEEARKKSKEEKNFEHVLQIVDQVAPPVDGTPENKVLRQQILLKALQQRGLMR